MNERSDTKGEAIVEDDQGCKPVARRGAGKPQAMIAVCVFEEEVKAICALQSRGRNVDSLKRKSARVGIAIGAATRVTLNGTSSGRQIKGSSSAGRLGSRMNMQPQRSESSASPVSGDMASNSMRWTTLA